MASLAGSVPLLGLSAQARTRFMTTKPAATTVKIATLAKWKSTWGPGSRRPPTARAGQPSGQQHRQPPPPSRVIPHPPRRPRRTASGGVASARSTEAPAMRIGRATAVAVLLGLGGLALCLAWGGRAVDAAPPPFDGVKIEEAWPTVS